MARSSLSGRLDNFRRLKSTLRKLPQAVAVRAAQRAAPELTQLTRSAFDSGRTVYDQPRPRGEEGNQLDLVETGAVRSLLRFDSFGTTVRAVLSTRYARFLIGKYKILPNGAIPLEWQKVLREIVEEELNKETEKL